MHHAIAAGTRSIRTTARAVRYRLHTRRHVDNSTRMAATSPLLQFLGAGPKTSMRETQHEMAGEYPPDEQSAFCQLSLARCANSAALPDLHGKAVSFTPSSASPLASYCEASFPGYGFSTSRPPVRIWFDHRLPPSGSTCCWRLLPQWEPVASPMTPTNLTTLTRSGQDGRKGGIGFSGIAAPFRGACIPAHRLDGMHILCARSAGCFPYPAPA
jgi:hypothetical protein